LITWLIVLDSQAFGIVGQRIFKLGAMLTHEVVELNVEADLSNSSVGLVNKQHKIVYLQLWSNMAMQWYGDSQWQK